MGQPAGKVYQLVDLLVHHLAKVRNGSLIFWRNHRVGPNPEVRNRIITALLFAQLFSLMDSLDGHVPHRTGRIDLFALNGKLGTPLPLLLDGFPLHAAGETFLIPAVLAAVSLAFVYRAVFVLPAGVGQVFPYRPLEESFASLTAIDTVMLSAGPIATDRTQMFGTAERVIWRILLAHVGGGSGPSSASASANTATGIRLLTVETVHILLLLLLKGCRDLLVERSGTGWPAVVSRRERTHTPVQQRYVRFEIGFHVLGRQGAHVTNEGGIESSIAGIHPSGFSGGRYANNFTAWFVVVWLVSNTGTHSLGARKIFFTQATSENLTGIGPGLFFLSGH